MRMRQLNSFIRACELGTITRAAAELNIAQPALGLHIRNLEIEFGHQLLVRSVRGIVPTAAGEIVLAWAREVLRSTEMVRRQIDLVGAAYPPVVTLGLTGGLTDHLSSMLSEEVSAQIPGMQLRIIKAFSNDIIKLLSSEQIDFGLTFEAQAPTGFTSTKLLSERLCYLSQRTEETGPISLTEVLSRPLTLLTSPSSVRKAVETAAHQAGGEINGGFDLHSLQTAKDLASCGLSGTILPFGAIHDEVNSPEVSVRLVVAPMIERTLYLVRQHDRAKMKVERDLCRIIDQTLKRFLEQNSEARQFWVVPDDIEARAAE